MRQNSHFPTTNNVGDEKIERAQIETFKILNSRENLDPNYYIQIILTSREP